MKLNTNLPGFNGFYGSIYDDVDTSSELDFINEIREQNGLTELENDDLINWDYETYYKDIALKLCESVEDFLNEINVVNSVGFIKIHSPKYYNFSNDVIECEVDVNSKNIRKYINNNLEEFTSHLIENHKSRDGFNSFYEYDLDFWLDRMENFKQLDHIEINSILNFICENEEFNIDIELPILTAENFEQLTT